MDESEIGVLMPESLFPFNLSAIGPTNERLREILSDKKNVFWKKPPYLHERGWVYAFVGFLERKDQNRVNEQFIEELIKFFKWHISLTPNHFPTQERLKNREIPLFIGESDILKMKEQLETLKKEDFLKDPKNLRWLEGVLRNYFNEINKRKIFTPNAQAIYREVEQILNSSKK